MPCRDSFRPIWQYTIVTRRSTAGGSRDDSVGEETRPARSPGFPEAGPPPEAVFEIEVVDGAEGQALAEVQASTRYRRKGLRARRRRCSNRTRRKLRWYGASTSGGASSV